MKIIRRAVIGILGGRIMDANNLELMPWDILASYIFERCQMLARGLMVFRRICFVGKGVRLKCKKRIKIGRLVTIHDYSYIDACSERGVVISDFCTIGKNAFIRTGNLAGMDGYLVMNEGSSCNANCFLGATGGLEIGKNVLMGPNIVILTERHNYDSAAVSIKSQGIQRTPVRIEDDVWVGASAVILGGVVLGTGSVVGAGSIVTKSVASSEIVAGNPAKVINKR